MFDVSNNLLTTLRHTLTANQGVLISTPESVLTTSYSSWLDLSSLPIYTANKGSNVQICISAKYDGAFTSDYTFHASNDASGNTKWLLFNGSQTTFSSKFIEGKIIYGVVPSRYIALYNGTASTITNLEICVSYNY